jgi:hypothetical protein
MYMRTGQSPSISASPRGFLVGNPRAEQCEGLRALSIGANNSAQPAGGSILTAVAGIEPSSSKTNMSQIITRADLAPWRAFSLSWRVIAAPFGREHDESV